MSALNKKMREIFVKVLTRKENYGIILLQIN